jgi:hypothetical protein
MVGLFSEQRSHAVIDTISETEMEVGLRGERIVTGISGFFERHELGVNDIIRISKASDGSVSFTARPRRRKPDWSTADAAEHVVQQLSSAGPVTEAEARALLPDLPEGFDLAGLLEADGRLQLQGGRWQAARSVPKAMAVQSGTPAARQGFAPGPARAAAIFAQLGFRVSAAGPGLLLECRLAAGSFRVLAHVAAAEGKPDWVSLLEQRDQAGADGLALIGDAPELLRLGAAAGLAKASLWSWSGLERVADYATSVPVSPLDLESHFRSDGMFEAGLDRFEKEIRNRISERGAFSAVLTRLAALGDSAVFQLDDVLGDTSREHAELVLEQLGHSPFQLVVWTAPGRYYLRGSVTAGLQQLGDYASSLLRQLPRSRNTPAAAPAGRPERERQEREAVLR